MKKGVLLLLALLLGGTVAYAEGPKEAAELTDSAVYELSGGSERAIHDGRYLSYTVIPEGGGVTVRAEGIASLYIQFDKVYGEWTLEAGGQEYSCGQNNFLHEFVDIAALTGETADEVTLRFQNGDCHLTDIYAFGPGEVPDWVQRWEPPCEQADLVLFSTHSDDEQMFFAGILPYYAGELGYQVQVAYFTNHNNTHDRPHEQLNGLWTVGVTHYPVMNEYPDHAADNKEEAYTTFARQGYTKEDMIQTQARLLRRFKPLVVVGHDINGEYGHGQHIVNSETLMEALPLAADPDYDPESAALYGAWDTPKAYIHLWKENPIVMDWDQPLERFGGRTAFQMTQEGFRCHESQHKWPGFYNWVYGPDGKRSKATEITTYSPCQYGLFRSTVGPDEAGGDMFEHLKTYGQMAKEAEEARLQAEEEARRKAEETARQQEEARALLQAEEEARRQAEEDLRQRTEARRQAEKERETIAIAIAALAAALMAGGFLAAAAVKRKKGSSGK